MVTGIGAPVRRVEDPPLVTGSAHYTDDLPVPGALHAAFVRSVMAHARIGVTDTAEAAAMPGVVAALTAADLDLPLLPPGLGPAGFARPPLAGEVVRFMGEAVAVVVAATREQALDAVEAVQVDYEPLPVVTDPVAALARRLGRPVRYVESRSETMLTMTHGRGQLQQVELGATREGVITDLKVRIIADGGAYPGDASLMPGMTVRMLCGPYRIRRVEAHASTVATNSTPVAAYRGAGRPEATWLLERMVDLLAARLGLDPAEVRRRNLIQPDAVPYDTVAGARYDSGDYPAALERVLQRAGYERLRAEQAERRRRGDRLQLGIGLAAYVETTGFGAELGGVTVERDGRVTVVTGTSPHGQGHETAWAQLAAGVLGVGLDQVRVVHSDTARVPSGSGTMASRSLQVGGSAVLRAGEQVLARGRELAAHLLEARVEDVVVHPGQGLGAAGAPATALSWAALAEAAADPAHRPPGADSAPALAAECSFEMPGSTYPFGAHLAVVEVDAETGLVRLLRHVAVDDSGRVLNPLLADGQVHGGIAQGVAQALFEEVRYDADGNNLTGTLASYRMPSAAELPSFETVRTETPSPLNPLGAKGIGESGTIGSTPAVHNAVVDALAPYGVTDLDMPATPERVWRAVETARHG